MPSTKQELCKKYYKLEIETSEDEYEQIATILNMEVTFGWEEQPIANNGIIFRIYCEDVVFLDSLQRLISEQCNKVQFRRDKFIQENWLEKWKEFFTPIICGSRFIVLPPWLANDQSVQISCKNRKKIIIDPKSAFGTGHHASTALCLCALSDILDKGILKEGDTFLDIGCGSGILGIGACLSGLTGIALDIDDLSISNAQENCILNDVTNMKLILGSIEKVEEKNFDLIMANILAAPLAEMAAKVVSCLKSGGELILSGILKTQAQMVVEAYMKCGLHKPITFEEGEWVALVWS